MKIHNFIRGNPIQTMKMMKTLRSKEENYSKNIIEGTPNSRKNNLSEILNVKSSFDCENKSTSIKNEKQCQTDETQTDLSMSFLNNQQNISQISQEEEKKGCTDFCNPNMNSQKKQHILIKIHDLKNRFKAQSIRKQIFYQNQQACIQNQNKFIHNQQINKQDSSNITSFHHQIKGQRLQKKFSVDNKENDLNKRIQELDISDSNNNSKIYVKNNNRFQPHETNKQVFVANINLSRNNQIAQSKIFQNSEIQYQIENNFKNRKRILNEIEQDLKQTQPQIDNNDWKLRLISTINEKSNQLIQNTPRQSQLQDNNLKDIQKFVNQSKSQSQSKRNSKEEDESIKLNETYNLTNRSHLNEQDQNIEILDKEKLPQKIHLSSNNNHIQNIFKEKVNFLDVLKKFSENFKNIKKRSKTQNSSHQNQLSTKCNDMNSKEQIKSKINDKNKQINKTRVISPSPALKTLTTTPKNHQNAMQLLFSPSKEIPHRSRSLTPQLHQTQILLNIQQQNSILYYEKMSSSRRKQSQEYNRKVQNHKYQETIQNYNAQELQFMQQINESIKQNLHSTRNIFEINKESSFENNKQFTIQQSDEQQQLNNITDINYSSYEIEPVCQQFLKQQENIIEKQSNIKQFYNHVNQRKKINQTNGNRNNQRLIFTDKEILYQNDLLKISNLSLERKAPISKSKQNQQIKDQDIQNEDYNQNKNEIEIRPWDNSRSSQLNDIDAYIMNIRKNTEIEL